MVWAVVIDYPNVAEVVIYDANAIPLFRLNKRIWFLLKNPDDGFDSDQMLLKAAKFIKYKKDDVIPMEIITRGGQSLPVSATVLESTHRKILVNRIVEREIVIDKRQTVKIDVNLETQIVGKVKDDGMDEFDPPLDAIVSDISVGGIFLEVQPGVMFDSDETIAITVDLGGDYSSIDLIVQVLRNSPTESGNTVGFGCSFPYLAPDAASIIERFINSKQVESRILDVK